MVQAEGTIENTIFFKHKTIFLKVFNIILITSQIFVYNCMIFNLTKTFTRIFNKVNINYILDEKVLRMSALSRGEIYIYI